MSPDPKTHPIHAFSNDLVESVCDLSPVLATFVGVRGYDSRWDDFSPAGVTKKAAAYREFSERLAKLPPATDRTTALAIRVHREHLDERLEFFASADPFLDLNHITSTFQVLTMVFDFMDQKSPEGLAAIASRLETMPAACAGYRELLAEGLASGRLVARRQVEAAIAQGRAKRAFAHALLDGPAADAAEHAFAELTDWLERMYLPKAPMRDGVGRERYERAMRRHLGAVIDPIETYAWGWEEIARIEATMSEIASTIRPGSSAKDVAAWLSDDPAHSLATPEPFLTAMRERQEQALAQLHGSHFDVPEPVRTIAIKLAPPGGNPGAYYSAPAEDFSRPGTVWYAPGTRTAIPIWQEITTAYHEGFPGHHLQVGMQVLTADRLTRFQRLLADWAGYAEGWALYAEQLMLELGYFEKPEYVLGMYGAQLTRACRVVVDIGLHLDLPIPKTATLHPGARWTFDLAVEMMRDRAFLEPTVAESEVVRYLGWPAQAISYKVGQRVILDLRAECTRRDGAAFDLKRFHSDVVGIGGVGLAALRESLLAT